MSMPDSLRALLQEGRYGESASSTTTTGRPSRFGSPSLPHATTTPTPPPHSQSADLDRQTARTLHKLTQQFIPADDPTNDEEFNQAYEECARILNKYDSIGLCQDTVLKGSVYLCIATLHPPFYKMKIVSPTIYAENVSLLRSVGWIMENS